MHLYLEGNGFNAIGCILGVSHVAVMKWIKQDYWEAYAGVIAKQTLQSKAETPHWLPTFNITVHRHSFRRC
jgi:uncharacterized protein YjcR